MSSLALDKVSERNIISDCHCPLTVRKELEAKFVAYKRRMTYSEISGGILGMMMDKEVVSRQTVAQT